VQTYTFQLTGIKDGKAVSMYVTCPPHPTSKMPLLSANSRASGIFRETIGVPEYTSMYVGDAERWFTLMSDPYITPEDHEWLHGGADAIHCWEYFTEEVE
jgi:hypothetical protein